MSFNSSFCVRFPRTVFIKINRVILGKEGVIWNKKNILFLFFGRKNWATFRTEAKLGTVMNTQDTEKSGRLCTVDRDSKANLLFDGGGLLGGIVDLLGSIETTEDASSDTEIRDLLVRLQGLDALLLIRDNLGAAPNLLEMDVGGSSATGENEDGEGDGSLLLAAGIVELELTLEGVLGSLLNLGQGDGSETNWGVNADIAVEDLDVEVVVMVRVEGVDGDVLLPLGVLASVLLDGGLLEGVLVGEIDGDLDIGVVLAEVLLGERRR